jgi:SAM-dependent methyltransferase
MSMATYEGITHIYRDGEYLSNNPSLHQEDSPWKVSKITPLIDVFMGVNRRREICLLDVGGGAGLILKAVTEHIVRKYNVRVRKYALDLSPQMLKIQKTNNSDIKKLLNEDIRKTSLRNKEVDLTLVIDVLEHIPNPTEALKELKRISRFALFKVPLEDNLYMNILNLVSRGRIREQWARSIGHINRYCAKTFSLENKRFVGEKSQLHLIELYDYYKQTGSGMKTMNEKVVFTISRVMYKISRLACVTCFGGFVLSLTACEPIKNDA